jgi:hypothetical protein
LVLGMAPKVIASMIEASVFSSWAPNVVNSQPEWMHCRHSCYSLFWEMFVSVALAVARCLNFCRHLYWSLILSMVLFPLCLYLSLSATICLRSVNVHVCLRSIYLCLSFRVSVWLN